MKGTVRSFVPSRLHQVQRHIVPVCIVIASLCTSGCKTPSGADGPPSEGLIFMPLVVIGAIIVSPVYVADKGWELSSDGLKTHVYASPGISLENFESAMNKAEGKTCHPDIESEPDHVEQLKYRGKNAVYYGRFVGGLAIKY